MKTPFLPFLALLFALSLGACQDAEWADMSESSDIPEGSGILTGEEGEIVLYRK